MLVEISEKTLERAKALDKRGREDMTPEEWAEFRMDGLGVCNSLIFDIQCAELRAEINNGPEIIPGTMDALNKITISNEG